jgi:hypothetical protein
VLVSLTGVFVVHNAHWLGLSAAKEVVAFPWLFPWGVMLCVGFAMLPLRLRAGRD